MKISVNDQELFTLSEIQCKVICNDIDSDEFESDMERRLQYILMHKYEQSFKRLWAQWLPILASRYETVPTNPEEFASLVFEQDDYKDKKQQNAESAE